jgi:hypothetical protein
MPVGGKVKEALRKESTWITGKVSFGKTVRVARPNGTIGLTFHAEKAAPPAWKALCKLFGADEGEKADIRLPAGSWYRMLCSMDLKIDDGLE